MNAMDTTTRRDVIRGGFCMAAASALGGCITGKPAEAEQSLVTAEEDAVLDLWQGETDLAEANVYVQYLKDGQTRGYASLEKLEAAFEKVLREAQETTVTGDRPAVWSVYNMGYIVKTREAMFSIDLVHRRAVEFAPLLDFALITHNHGDHWRHDFYSSMNMAGKTVISNFLDNYGVRGWRKNGGYIRGVKEFRLKDVEVRTSLIDHNDYLIDYTTAFEIKIGDFRLYHTGDSGKGTEPKLVHAWGRPDLWLFFPGCGIDVAKAVSKVNAKRVVFGHLWELGHVSGRLKAPLIRRALNKARPHCSDVSFALWGDRVC
ncbi:MAG: MBL fold metallo-hydrolase [Kiritimatiellae bacterium]|nr:MBL fold metallo-hydrolase [Kiritimatiellia bacterium]